MKRRAFIRMGLGSLALLMAAPFPVTGPQPALAQQRDQDEALRARKQAKLIPYGQISRRAQQQFGGRVVGQQVRQMSKNHWVYELRILQDDGKVISVVIDAHTGQVLGTRGRR